MKISLASVTSENIHILLNLAQAYEAEFSAITKKKPNNDGVFVLDAMPQAPFLGYILYHAEIPIGFSVINVKSTPKDIAEFYVIPAMRHQKIGMKFAHSIFSKHPGAWQVRQIQGATNAVKFWQHTISIYTNNNYEEEIVDDPYWGMVTKQNFSAG